MEHAFQQGRRIFQQQTGDLPQPKDTDQLLQTYLLAAKQIPSVDPPRFIPSPRILRPPSPFPLHTAAAAAAAPPRSISPSPVRRSVSPLPAGGRYHVVNQTQTALSEAPSTIPLQPLRTYLAQPPQSPQPETRPMMPSVVPLAQTTQATNRMQAPPNMSIPMPHISTPSRASQRDFATPGSVTWHQGHADSQPRDLRPRRMALSPSPVRSASPTPYGDNPVMPFRPCVPLQVPGAVPVYAPAPLPQERVRPGNENWKDSSISQFSTPIRESLTQSVHPNMAKEHMGEMLNTLWRRTSTFAEECSRWNHELEQRHREAQELASTIQRLSEQLAAPTSQLSQGRDGLQPDGDGLQPRSSQLNQGPPAPEISPQTSPRPPSRPSPLASEPGLRPVAAIQEATGLIMPERAVEQTSEIDAEVAPEESEETTEWQASPVEALDAESVDLNATEAPPAPDSGWGSGSIATESTAKVLLDEPEEGELFEKVRTALSRVVGADAAADGLQDPASIVPPAGWEESRPPPDPMSPPTISVGSTVTQGEHALSSESAWVGGHEDEEAIAFPENLEDLVKLLPNRLGPEDPEQAQQAQQAHQAEQQRPSPVTEVDSAGLTWESLELIDRATAQSTQKPLKRSIPTKSEPQLPIQAKQAPKLSHSKASPKMGPEPQQPLAQGPGASAQGAGTRSKASRGLSRTPAKSPSPQPKASPDELGQKQLRSFLRSLSRPRSKAALPASSR